jgi:RNA polymerase sigma-70 factor, ECF subfamily
MGSNHDLHEELVVAKAQMGDPAAFEQLIRKYHPKIIYYIRKMLLRKDLAADVAQNVWLAVWRKFARLRATEAFNVWLYRIAHAETINLIRDESRYTELPAAYDAAQDGHDADEGFSDEDIRLLNLAVESLNPPLREAITLRFIEAMSYEDIALVTGVPVGTVRSRLHYAKQALRRRMEELKDEQE